MSRHPWRRAACAAVAAVALLTPTAAQAANPGDPNSIVSTGGVVTITSDSGQQDAVYFQNESATSVLIRTHGSGFPDANLTGCVFVTLEFNYYRQIRCNQGATITKIVVNSLDEADNMGMWTGTLPYGVEIHAGDGSDSISGSNQSDQLFGDAGRDYLYGNLGADNLDGGADRDFLQGGGGGDNLVGGTGFDQVAYYEKGPAQPVSITLDDVANDGESGEGDNVRTSVEDMIGGQGNDSMTGSSGANEIDGNSGNDVIDAGTGTDRIVGGPGNDLIIARDGNAERVDCSEDSGDADADVAKTDTIDEVSGCEQNDAASDLQPDRDGDGFQSPADCNDTNGAINPGAADKPDDGIDQNCDGKDAQNLDKDGDGFNKDVDCDDNNPNAKPGGTEIVGNEIDENCDGLAPPTPVIETPVGSNFDFDRGITTVLALNVGELPAGTTVIVRCIGKKKFGCPTKEIKKTVSKKTAGINFFKRFRKARFRKGATIEVQITKPGFVGRLVRFKMKPKAAPTPQPLCINPGETKAKAC